jgi:hypothetical protein
MLMIPKHLLDSIDVRWHNDLLQFIDSGDASLDFLEFLDRDPQCQQVVEVAFALLSQDIQAVADDLRRTLTDEAVATCNTLVITRVVAEAVSTFSNSLQALPAEEQRKVLDNVERVNPEALRDLRTKINGEAFLRYDA